MLKKLELNTIKHGQQLTVGTNGSTDLTAGNQVALGITLNLKNVVTGGTTSSDYARLMANLIISGADEYINISGVTAMAIAKANGSFLCMDDNANTNSEDDAETGTHDVSISLILPCEMSADELPKVKILWATLASMSETPGQTVITGTVDFTQFFIRDAPEFRTFLRETELIAKVTGVTQQGTLPVIPNTNLDVVGVDIHSQITAGAGGVQYNSEDYNLKIKNGANVVLETEDTMLSSITGWLKDRIAPNVAYSTIGDVPSSTNIIYYLTNNTGATVDIHIWYLFTKSV